MDKNIRDKWREIKTIGSSRAFLVARFIIECDWLVTGEHAGITDWYGCSLWHHHASPKRGRDTYISGCMYTINPACIFFVFEHGKKGCMVDFSTFIRGALSLRSSSTHFFFIIQEQFIQNLTVGNFIFNFSYFPDRINLRSLIGFLTVIHRMLENKFMKFSTLDAQFDNKAARIYEMSDPMWTP